MSRIELAKAIEAKRKESVNIHWVYADEGDDAEAILAQAKIDHPFQECRVIQYVTVEGVKAEREAERARQQIEESS